MLQIVFIIVVIIIAFIAILLDIVFFMFSKLAFCSYTYIHRQHCHSSGEKTRTIAQSNMRKKYVVVKDGKLKIFIDRLRSSKREWKIKKKICI